MLVPLRRDILPFLAAGARSIPAAPDQKLSELPLGLRPELAAPLRRPPGPALESNREDAPLVPRLAGPVP